MGLNSVASNSVAQHAIRTNWTKHKGEGERAIVTTKGERGEEHGASSTRAEEEFSRTTFMPSAAFAAFDSCFRDAVYLFARGCHAHSSCIRKLRHRIEAHHHRIIALFITQEKDRTIPAKDTKIRWCSPLRLPPPSCSRLPARPRPRSGASFRALWS